MREKQLTEILVIVNRHCYWFYALCSMKTDGMEASVESLMSPCERGAYTSQRGVKSCSLHNLISNALQPLQSEESEKGPPEFEQRSKK